MVVKKLFGDTNFKCVMKKKKKKKLNPSSFMGKRFKDGEVGILAGVCVLVIDDKISISKKQIAPSGNVSIVNLARTMGISEGLISTNVIEIRNNNAFKFGKCNLK